jgi:hypothetical protein
MKLKISKQFEYAGDKTACNLSMTVEDWSYPLVIDTFGVTQRRDPDVYDKAIGERIAESKALITAYKELINELSSDGNELAKQLAEVDRLQIKINLKLERELLHKTKLINRYENS